MEEIWKDVKGYEGLYQVSNMGRVKSLDRWCPRKDGHKLHVLSRILKPQANRGGGKRGQAKGRYLFVPLCREHKHKFVYIHRLVIEAFIENPDPEKYTQCNHKDENTYNNVLSNLEWCTPKENVNHGTRNERANAPLRKKVLMFTKEGKFIREFVSAKEAARLTGIWSSSISCCCRKLPKFNTAGGYRWAYSDNK
jgi:hypothetical protein